MTVSHSNCSRHAVDQKDQHNYALSTRLHLPRTEARNLQSLAPWLSPERLVQGRSAWCSGVSSPRSLHIHRRGQTPPYLIAPASSVKAKPSGLEPKRRLTSSSAAAASSVSACAPFSCNSLLIRSSFNPRVDKPRRHDTTRISSRRVACISLRLAEHPGYSRVAVSRQHLCHQQPAPAPASATNASTRTTHPTISNMTSCARLTVATWTARASKSFASTFIIKEGCDHKPPRTPSHSQFRQQLFNQMLRHQVRHFVIRRNSLQPFCSRSCVHMCRIS